MVFYFYLILCLLQYVCCVAVDKQNNRQMCNAQLKMRYQELPRKITLSRASSVYYGEESINKNETQEKPLKLGKSQKNCKL